MFDNTTNKSIPNKITKEGFKMSHNLNMNEEGKASMMYTGQTPWHRLGTYLGENAVTSEEAIKAANMDWEVSIQEISCNNTIIPDFKAIVRDDTKEVLGIRKNQYTPYQNSDAFKVLDLFVGLNQAVWHTAGVLGKGERIWILAKLPGTIEVTKNDIIEKYFLLMNSHDGSTGIKLAFSPIRVVCANTLQMALVGNDASIMSIKHTKNQEIKIKQALKLLGLVEKLSKSFEDDAKEMYNLKMSDTDIDNYLADIINITEETKEKVKLYEDKAFLRYKNSIESGIGTDIPGVKGSLWGVYNAVTESIDHTERKIKNELQYKMFGAGGIIKDRAWKVAKKLIR